MPNTANISVRLSVMLLVSVILQLAVITQFTPFGVVPDVVPVMVVAIGMLAGATTGATTGFFAGLLIDLALLQTLGVSSLLLTVTGYGAGRLRELRDPVGSFVNPAVGAIATAFYVLGFGILQFSLGAPAPLAITLVWHTTLATTFGALLAIPVFALVRRVLLPTLDDDPLYRRRRAVTVPYRFQAPRERARGWRL